MLVGSCNTPTCAHSTRRAKHTYTSHPSKRLTHTAKPLRSPLLAVSVTHPQQRERVRARVAFQDSADVVPQTNEEYEDDEGRAVPSATKIMVVGGGPIGLLTASYFARRGYMVDVLECQPHPALQGAQQKCGPDHPIVLSSRALLAFRELRMHMSFAAPEAVPHRGTYHMAEGGKLTPAHPGHPYKATVVTSKHRLQEEILQEMRRLYPHRVRITYGAQLVTADLESRKAVVARQQGHQGGTMFAGGLRDNGPGNVMMSSVARPAGDPASVTEDIVPYDLLIGADGANSIVRECMLKAKVKQLSTQRPMEDMEAFVAVSGLPQYFGQTSNASSPKNTATGSHSSSPTESPSDSSALSSSAGASSSGEGSGSSSESIGSSQHTQPQPQAVQQQQQPQQHLQLTDIQGHRPGEYLYEWRKRGAPTVQLWVPEPGHLSGIVQGAQSWEEQLLEDSLAAAYGDSLPQEWRSMIVQQASAAAAAGRLGRYGATVQSTQYHGPRVLLVGDAAHAMTGELQQGLNCGIEGIRMLNIVLRASQDNLDRAPTTHSEVRGEDAQCMQQLEAFQRTLRGNLVYGDPLFRLASAIGSVVWRSALLTLSLLRKVWPNHFPEDYVQQQVMDARHGYNEVLKVMVRYAVLPVIALLGVLAAGMKAAVASGKIVL